MSDDRRRMCCGEEFWTQQERFGLCIGCQDDEVRPGDFDNDPDQMLSDGDPAEP